jgi:hypothetical protein
VHELGEHKEVVMHKMVMIALAAGIAASCVSDEREDGTRDEHGEEQLSEHTSSLVVGGRYCVRSSSTGAYRNTRPAGPPECTGFGSTFPVTATLNAGTLLIITANCGSPAFVNGSSGGAYYMLRASALAPC